MKKNRVFLILGIVMVIAAVGFVIYALNNPQASFPWSNSITYGIYLAYAVITVFLIVAGLRKRPVTKNHQGV